MAYLPLDEKAIGKAGDLVTADFIVGIVCDLIGIPSHRDAAGRESGVAQYIQSLLEREGIETELRDVRPGRPNVIGRLRGRAGKPALMFNGHTDTVPPGTMDAPLEARIADGAVWGRGACDMKGGLAAQLAAMIGLKRAAVELEGDLIFTGVIAEEDATNFGSLDIVENGPRADMVVVAEPTMLKVAAAHKGFDYFRIDVPGIAGHSSRPELAVNAIYRASAIVAAIEQRFVPGLAAVKHPLVGSAVINVTAVRGYAESEAATAFGGGSMEKPPGGTVPDVCTIYLDYRRLPGAAVEDILAALQELVAEVADTAGAPPARVSFTPAAAHLETHPPLDTDPDHALVREALRVASHELGRPQQAIGVPYWSDAALFNAAWKVPAIVFGPGDIAFAHSDEEHIPIDQLVRATRANAALAVALLAPG